MTEHVNDGRITITMHSSSDHPRAGTEVWRYEDLVTYHQNYYPNDELTSWNSTWFSRYQTGIGPKALFVRLFMNLILPFQKFDHFS